MQCGREKERESDKKNDINKTFAFGFQLFIIFSLSLFA